MFGRGNLGLAGRGGGHLFISIREHLVFGGISPPTLFESLLQFLSLIKYLLHGSEYNIEKCLRPCEIFFYEPKASENMA